MRVPLVIVTGFLGSGKTTLVNRMLAHRAELGDKAHGKLGVIVNELGEVGIDGALLGGDLTKQIELPGGCVCCVMSEDLDRTLLDLVEKNPGLDAIVLETTGVAEPLPIAWAANREPVSNAVRLAAVVTLVDATNFIASRRVSAAVDAQVAYADVLLVTKSELAGDAGRATIDAARDLAPRASIRVGPTDAHAAWLEELMIDPELVAPVDRPADQGDHVHDETCRHSEHRAHGIDSVWVGVSGVLDLEELSDQLTELPNNYVRIKGILRAVDSARGETQPAWTAVHRVGLRVSSELVAAPDFEQGRLVALGPGVEIGPLAACVKGAQR